MKGELPTFIKIRGAPVLLHWSFFLLLILHLVLSFIAYKSWKVFWFQLILYGPFLFIIALFHEIPKAIMAYRQNATIEDIVLWPLGGLSLYGPDSPMGDVKVAILGPLSHVFTGAIFGVVYIMIKAEGMPSLLSYQVYYADIESGLKGIFASASRIAFCWNLMLLVVHLLVPVYPMDAVRIWGGLLRSSGKSLADTAKFTAYAGILICFGIFIYGWVGLFRDESFGGGITEFSAYIVLGGFGALVSWNLVQTVNADRINLDKVFGRGCYAITGSGVEMPGAVSAPALPVEEERDII